MDVLQVDLTGDYGFRQGDEVGGDWRVLGDHRIELAIGSFKPDLWAGSTQCVKVIGRKVGPFFRLTAAISIQHKTGAITHAVFFEARPIYFDQLSAERGVELVNFIGADGVTGIGVGGFVDITADAANGDDETSDERVAICRTCPSGMFRPAGADGGDACLALRCCNRREPDPDRWRAAIENGACPRRHFRKRGGFTVSTPIRSGKLLLGEKIVPTL